ncbi:MAG: SCO family protein [Candidatus Binatia bacterium]
MDRECGLACPIIGRPERQRRWGLWCLLLLLLSSLWAPVDGHCEGERAHSGKETDRLGIDERLGATVPLDLTFQDEQGNPVRLRELIDKPTVLSLAYYTCPNVCPRILSSMAEMLGLLDMEAGRDFTAVTVSFDGRDNPASAREKKKNYIKAIGKPFPAEEWRFLTGDSEAIQRLTDAIGYRFQRRGDVFDHPASLIVLSDRGKIIRYLYGVTYLPLDVKMALTEASAGRVGPTIRRALLFCFSYDPEGRTYVFNVLKVSATVILFFGAIFLVFLVGTSRMRKKDAR